MVTIYRYLPGWTVPCISPFVTKVIYYMEMAGVKYQAVSQDLSRLDADTPHGKLPVIVDTDGTRVADSTQIVSYLKSRYGDPLDGDAGSEELGQMHAWNRMLDEHTYWVAVIQPRWRETANWEIYLRIIAGTDDVPAPLRAFADDFRFRILSQFMLGGWGRMPAEVIYRRARADIDALSSFLGAKSYFMGSKPRSIDTSLLAILRHTIDTPFQFDTKDYAKSKQNLVDYMERMKDRFGI
jgi:glutathione S-transferase